MRKLSFDSVMNVAANVLWALFAAILLVTAAAFLVFAVRALLAAVGYA